MTDLVIGYYNEYEYLETFMMKYRKLKLHQTLVLSINGFMKYQKK